MAVRIRLRRIGKKKQAQYRLVAAEAAGPRDGRFVEMLGHYNPRVDPPAVSVDEERVLHWLRQGAQPTETAKSLLVRAGVWEKFTGEKAQVRPPPPPKEAGEEEVAEKPLPDDTMLTEVRGDEQPNASQGGKREETEEGVEREDTEQER